MWFKVDDKTHETHRRLSLAADGLWTLAGSWSVGNKTEGFIPEGIVTPRWASRTTAKKLAGELVAAGMWEPTAKDGEPGWQFVDWHEHQDGPTVGPFQAESIGRNLRLDILERDDFTCRSCGAMDELLEIDHIVPRVKGGTNDPSNLQVLCQSCNARKGAR